MQLNWVDPHGTHILKKYTVKSLWKWTQNLMQNVKWTYHCLNWCFSFHGLKTIQTLYSSCTHHFRKTCKAFWVVPLEVTGFCMYPSAHGRTASLRLKVRSVRLIPITSPNICGVDTRHGSSTAKVTWLWISSTAVMHSESLQEKLNQRDHHVIYTVIIRWKFKI